MCVLEVDHHEHGDQQANNVGDEAGIEVDMLATIQADVKAQQERNEDARNDDIAKAEHSELLAENSILQKILRKDELDWCVKRLGYSHHHIGTKHPEDVVHKEATQENASCNNIAQVDVLDCLDGESKAKEIIGNPVLQQSEYKVSY